MVVIISRVQYKDTTVDHHPAAARAVRHGEARHPHDRVAAQGGDSSGFGDLMDESCSPDRYTDQIDGDTGLDQPDRESSSPITPEAHTGRNRLRLPLSSHHKRRIFRLLPSSSRKKIKFIVLDTQKSNVPSINSNCSTLENEMFSTWNTMFQNPKKKSVVT
jgi:hypothetical protein